MSASTIPSGPTNEILQWANNFRATLNGNLVAYGISAGEAAAMTTNMNAFNAAFALAGVINRTAVNPAGYTQPNRDGLVVAQNTAIAQMRPLANRIRVNPAISDAMKLAAGVMPVNLDRARLIVPNNSPTLNVHTHNVLAHVLNFVVSDNPTQKSRPKGATGVLLYGLVSATPVVDPTQMCLIGSYTKQGMVTPQFAAADAGKTVYYAARWAGKTNQMGPWSNIIATTIVGA